MKQQNIPINLTLFLLCLIIQNCSSTLILGTTTLATKILKDPRPIGTQINDKTLEIHIANVLSKNKTIKNNTRIIHHVYQGNVLLIGQSPSLNNIKQIENTVMHVHGIKKIYNEIRNTHTITLKKILFDWWISSKIYLYCLTNTNIKLLNIKVITENKEVFLLGNIPHQDKKTIIHTISKIHGVKHIIVGLIYT